MSPHQNLSIDQWRSKIVEEAISWLRTPWHHEARVKGAGVDCAQFLIAVYSAVGLVEPFETHQYSPDWHLHRDEPLFLQYLRQYAVEVQEPLPGDIVMWNFGRHEAHGSIVVEWPLIIHAYKEERAVCYTDVSTSPIRRRLAGFYRLKELAE